jgi:RimJ/RimL family protein N-acetyltransferase
MELQTFLSNELIALKPLRLCDLEDLYKVASDPLIWEQHPNSDRYKREVFEKYFQSAIESKGAYTIHDRKSNTLIGCTRYYEYDRLNRTIAIGFTFIDRAHWGNGYNATIKKLMCDYAFKFVNNIYFHVGSNNVRSRKAVEKLGAKLLETNDIDKVTYCLSTPS